MTFSTIAIVSFLCLLGGNLVGCGRILSFVFDISIGGTAYYWLLTTYCLLLTADC